MSVGKCTELYALQSRLIIPSHPNSFLLPLCGQLLSPLLTFVKYWSILHSFCFTNSKRYKVNYIVCSFWVWFLWKKRNWEFIYITWIGSHSFWLLSSILMYRCVTVYPFICWMTIELFLFLAIMNYNTINIGKQVFV